MAELRDLAPAIASPDDRAWLAIGEAMTAWLAGDVRRTLEGTAQARARGPGTSALGAFELAQLGALELRALALRGHHDAALRSAGELLATARARGDWLAM